MSEHCTRIRARQVGVALIATVAGPLLSLAAMGCGGSTEPKQRDSGPPFAVVAGGSATDTVLGKPAQALVVEVRDPGGTRAPGVVVRFQALPPTTPGRGSENAVLVAQQTSMAFGSFAAVETDERGRASVVLQLGTVAGTARLEVSVPEFGLKDTVEYTVLAGASSQIVFAVRDTLVHAGATYQLGAASADRFGNRRPNDAITFASTSQVASVNAQGMVTAGAVGRGSITATSSAATSTANLTVVPAASIVMVSTRSGFPVIATVDVDGSNYRPLATSTGSLFYPRWNHQGTRIVFQQGGDDGQHLYLLTPGGTPTRLVDVAAGMAQEQYARFSPDGSSVYFSGRAQSAPFNAVNVFRATVSTGAVEYIGPGTPGQDLAWAPAPSPDGSRLVFSASGSMKLLDLSTRTVTNLPAAGALPEFSPAGDRIAFLSSSQGPLSVMNVDGSSVRGVSGGDGGYSSSAGFSWSPDGQWIIVRGYSGLELLNVQSGQRLQLPGTGDMYQPSFHP